VARPMPLVAPVMNAYLLISFPPSMTYTIYIMNRIGL
jgi:hypothetical protein